MTHSTALTSPGRCWLCIMAPALALLGASSGSRAPGIGGAATGPGGPAAGQGGPEHALRSTHALREGGHGHVHLGPPRRPRGGIYTCILPMPEVRDGSSFVVLSACSPLQSPALPARPSSPHFSEEETEAGVMAVEWLSQQEGAPSERAFGWGRKPTVPSRSSQSKGLRATPEVSLGGAPGG